MHFVILLHLLGPLKVWQIVMILTVGKKITRFNFDDALYWLLDFKSFSYVKVYIFGICSWNLNIRKTNFIGVIFSIPYTYLKK